MSKIERYRETLRTLSEWDAFLMQESGLPGPRGNLELAQAVADEGDEALFRRYLTLDPISAPTNSPQEFLAFCGVLGLGKLVAEGRREWLAELRARASDPRWRTREAVAMALQRLGKADMEALLDEMETWSQGSALEQRASMAALCEPVLLGREEHVARVLRILDRITLSLEQSTDRRNEEYRVLRQGLAYGWSVAVAAQPALGKPAMERWLDSPDPDVRWVMHENLKKARLARMDADWVTRWREAP
jgi:hypothetical protein